MYLITHLECGLQNVHCSSLLNQANHLIGGTCSYFACNNCPHFNQILSGTYQSMDVYCLCNLSMQSFIMNSHEVFIHIHQGCFAGTGAIVTLPQCQWSKPDGYGKISQCITTTKHSKAKTMCIFLGIYCRSMEHQCVCTGSKNYTLWWWILLRCLTKLQIYLCYHLQNRA